MSEVHRSMWIRLGIVGLGAVVLIGVLVANIWSRSLQDYFVESKTVCAGRYDLDIPATFDIRINSAGLNGFAVEPLGRMDRDAFEATVDARRRALQNGITDLAGETIRLRWSRDSADVRILAVDVDFDVPGIVRSGYRIEAYRWINEQVFKLDGRIVGARESRDLTNLMDVAAGLRVGDGPGFCFDGGRYPDVLPTQGVSAFIHDPALTGYGLRLSIYEGTSAPSDIADPAGTRSLRAKRRQIAGHRGYEVQIVTRGETGYDNREVLKFLAFAGKAGRRGEPFVKISATLFKNAASADAPPYDVEMSRALWDLVLTSLRTRQ